MPREETLRALWQNGKEAAGILKPEMYNHYTFKICFKAEIKKWPALISVFLPALSDYFIKNLSNASTSFTPKVSNGSCC